MFSQPDTTGDRRWRRRELTTRKPLTWGGPHGVSRVCCSLGTARGKGKALQRKAENRNVSCAGAEHRAGAGRSGCAGRQLGLAPAFGAGGCISRCPCAPGEPLFGHRSPSAVPCSAQERTGNRLAGQTAATSARGRRRCRSKTVRHEPGVHVRCLLLPARFSGGNWDSLNDSTGGKNPGSNSE